MLHTTFSLTARCPRSGQFGVADGASADQVLVAMRAWDPDIDRRQFALVDRHGGAAAHTGAETHDFAAHRLGDGYAAAGSRSRSR